MSNEWILLAWFFVAVTGLAFLIFRRVGGRRVEQPRAADDGEDHPPLGRLTPAMAGAVPMTLEGESELRKDLRNAGFYSPQAVTQYAAIRGLLVLVPLIVTTVYAVILPDSQTITVVLFGTAAVVLGYSLPRVYLAGLARTRNRQIERGLPVAMDLMTLCLTAGQTLVAGLAQAAREVRQPFPALAEELAITEQQARLHSLEHALQQWADRVQVPEVRNLALMLIQSERLGTDTAGTLLEYANSIRTLLRQRAEARAARASFWMLFPSVFCLWTAAAIILIGPTYLEFWQHRRDSLQLLQSGKTVVTGSTERRASSASPGEAAVAPPAQPQQPTLGSSSSPLLRSTRSRSAAVPAPSTITP